VFIAQAHEMSTELLSTWRQAAAFLSASGAALSQEVADGKYNVQSHCALNTRYIHVLWKSSLTFSTINPAPRPITFQIEIILM
jgi:hypothetical protein